MIGRSLLKQSQVHNNSYSGSKIGSILYIVNSKLLNSPYIQMLDEKRLIYARQFRDKFNKKDQKINDGKIYQFPKVCLNIKEILDKVEIEP